MLKSWETDYFLAELCWLCCSQSCLLNSAAPILRVQPGTWHPWAAAGLEFGPFLCSLPCLSPPPPRFFFCFFFSPGVVPFTFCALECWQWGALAMLVEEIRKQEAQMLTMTWTNITVQVNYLSGIVVISQEIAC